MEYYVGEKKLNYKRVLIVIIMIIIILLLIIFGIVIAQNHKAKKISLEAQKRAEEEEEIMKIAIETQKKEEEERQRQKEKEEEANATGIIYLTFDDGPTASSTPIIMDILKNRGVKATFFVLHYSDENEQYIKREKEESHTIALHGYSHTYSEVYQSARILF